MNRFSSRVVLSGMLICLLLGQVTAAEKVDFAALTERLQAMIADRETNEDDLREAISRLGKVSEPISFWNNIIRNPTYSRQHRRRCVEALLRRHHPGTFDELLVFLDNPVWLRDKDIEKVDWVVGSIPVDITRDGSVFQIRILPTDNLQFLQKGDNITVYVRVAGKVTLEEFRLVLRPYASLERLEAIVVRPIEQIGFSEY